MSTSQNTSSKHNKGRTYTIKTTTHTGYSKYARSLLFSSSFAFVNARRGVKIGDVLREIHRIFNDSF